MFGPGVAASAAHARQKSSQDSSGIMRASNALDRERRRFAAADAKRRHAALAIVFAHRAEQRYDDARTRRADRMAERAGAAMHVHAVARDAVLLHRGHRHDGEG